MRDMQNMKSQYVGKYSRYGGLKTWVLYTLSEEPKNGAEIMDSIESISWGAGGL